MNGDLNILQLVLGASLLVKLVLGVLVAFSFLSWVIIFRKKAMLDRAMNGANAFEERFWSGADLAVLHREVTAESDQITGIESIFESGYREFARLRQRRQMDSRTMLEGAQRAMRVALSRGLCGTVWGIMGAFSGLASVKEATIAMVAPGISEALIATAMGLFAAIPAVWAYNRYATRLERITVRYESFLEEFSSILQRQAHIEDHGNA